jgi:hypothetical protein
MQIQEKKQGLLITPFFGLEIDWKNDYLTYIDTSFKKVTSSLDNTKNNIKSFRSDK